MNKGTICAKVYPEGVQPVKRNNCGLIPFGKKLFIRYSVRVFRAHLTMFMCVLLSLLVLKVACGI